MKRMGVCGLAVFLFLCGVVFDAATEGLEDFSLWLVPSAEIPLGQKSAVLESNAMFELGASADFRGQYIFPKLPLVFLDFGVGYHFQPTQANTGLSLLTAGVGPGLNMRIGNIMSLQVGAEGGWYAGFFGDTQGAGNPYFGGRVAFGWDFTPAFSLNVGAGYRYYLGYNDSTESFTDLVQGARVSVGTVFRFATDTERTKVAIRDPRFKPLFPVFHSYYDESSVGEVRVVNGENTPITNVNVSFIVNQYMEQPKLSASFPVLRRGERVDVELYALFNNSIMQLTEPSKSSAEVVVEYDYLGKTFVSREPYTVRILNRNAMTWDDDRKAACFVTAKDPTVLLFSKNTAGLIRDYGNSPVNDNLRIGMAIFEALRLYGMNYIVDPESSYIEASKDAQFIDYLQFPSESLTYRAGDCDDLSILYAALLESVNVEAAFITIPAHIYIAFSLGLSEQDAKDEFSNTDDFIFVDGETWVPVEITLVTDGFMKAWKIGARQWREAQKSGTVDFYRIHQAWEEYEPVSSPNANALSLLYPSQDAIVSSYEDNLNEFISREIADKLEHYTSRVSRADNARNRNRLGILYARYGLYTKAEEQFILSNIRDDSYVPALVNLGNIAYLREDYETSMEWYSKAERYSPDSAAVLAGLSRAQYELDNYDRAREVYARLAAEAPEIAEQYAYIDAQSTALGRASAARDKGVTIWGDDNDR